VQRRVSNRGSIAVAHQRVTVGMTHAGAIVDVEAADTTFRVYLDDQLLTEVARTTNKPIARFKAHKPEPPRATRTQPDPGGGIEQKVIHCTSSGSKSWAATAGRREASI
jgi:hypothetical protein